MAESGNDSPEDHKVYLPSCYTKNDVYEIYVFHMKALGILEKKRYRQELMFCSYLVAQVQARLYFSHEFIA